MKIKAKQIFFVGAFIVLTLLGYIIMPKDEVIIDLSSDSAGEANLNDVNGNQGTSSSKSGNQQVLETIFVHIEGAVNSPGIKEVPKGTRVFEVVNLAHGETEDADLSKINLASIVKDEQKIYVPYKIVASSLTVLSEQSNETTANNTLSSNDVYAGLININSATSEELQQLDGIGPSMAKKILDYRDEIGYFGDIEDIKNVSGIGEAKYNKIKDDITI